MCFPPTPCFFLDQNLSVSLSQLPEVSLIGGNHVFVVETLEVTVGDDGGGGDSDDGGCGEW